MFLFSTNRIPHERSDTSNGPAIFQPKATSRGCRCPEQKSSTYYRRTSSERRTIPLLLLLIALQLNHVPTLNTQQQVARGMEQPIFRKSMDSATVKENVPIGEIVYTLEAQVEGSDLPVTHISFGIDGTSLFKVDKTSGQVRVAQLIDREQTSDSVSFQVSATPYYVVPGLGNNAIPGPVARITVTVIILDENDNPPKIELVRVGRQEYDSQLLMRQSAGAQGPSLFSQQRSTTPMVRLNVSESSPVGSVIVDLIAAIDIDNASANPLRAYCLDCEPEFELRPVNQNSLLNDQLNSSIILVNPLIHEPRKNVRLLKVIINDGKSNSTILFEVTIDDIQNRPPQFIGSSTCVVKENVPIDTTIMTLQAIDGDALGFDELPSPLTGSPSMGRQILYDFVSSGEQSSAGLNSELKLHPLTGQLQVANRLDRELYLSSNGVLSLKVRARELTLSLSEVMSRQAESYDSILQQLVPYVDQAPETSSEMAITVILVDVNDQEPHWLNASEIAKLNMNQAQNWYNSLPSDPDTGRVYQLHVNENSLAGSPITTRNEMFVYDLDNGDNAKFNLTLVDPFKLFDVEPKQVSGFALVTLKLAASPYQLTMRRSATFHQAGSTGTRVLDYENSNERSFIIQLIATETNTGERYTSKAQIQINVLDVNDNPPEFKEPAYVVNIREDAPPGKTVLMVQATDKDEVSKQLQYSLHGHSAHLLDLNRQSGLLTVAKCETDGAIQASTRAKQQRGAGGTGSKCIDFEQQKVHHLMLEVSDGELSSKVPLTVYVDDANDNPPVFSLPIVDVVIEEGSERLDPPIKIEATDVDQSSVLSYSIVEGNFEGLFSINNATGELQLTRPIRIAHDDGLLLQPDVDGQQPATGQLQLNKLTLTVEASDGFYSANGTVRIDVLDANDNAPKFLRPSYSFDVPETVSQGQVIATVRAIDSDRGNNARVSYRLQRGSYGQFEIDEATGALSVAHHAQEFDSSKRENYTLEVVASDHGLVPKSSSILVHVRILDTIKRVPRFEPRIQRTTVAEGTLNNTIIHRMQVVAAATTSGDANNPSQASRNELLQMQLASSMLVFEPGPIEALDKHGQPVNGESESERLTSMFSVSINSGDVMVNSALDHDFAAHVNLTIYVSLRQPLNHPDSDEQLIMATQRSVGYLLINVLDDNTNAPIFGAPWSPQRPELEFKMLEELPAGSVLTQLVAYDLDSKISHFKIEPPNEYFELTSPQSGEIVNKKLIDYDTLMSQTFLKPRLANSSSSLAASADNNIIQFNVYAYDSGQPQLSARATVSVEILPVNDWDCRFEQSTYEVRVKENSPAESALVQVRATDLDYGEHHNSIRYKLIGDHSELFNLDPRTGLLTVSNKGSHQLDRERLNQPMLALTVIGRDEQQPPAQVAFASGWPGHASGRSARGQSFAAGGSQTSSSERSCSASIRIYVDDVNDNPPLFSQRHYEVTAYDTDVADVPLLKLIVRDDDALVQQHPSGVQASNKSSPAPTNAFKIISGNANDSFSITSSGLLRAVKPLNFEALGGQQSILLRIQVRQQAASVTGGALTSFTDECEVRINLVRINRYGPEWRQESLKGVTVGENARVGTLVAQLRCFDRDHVSTDNKFRHRFNKFTLDEAASNSTLSKALGSQTASDGSNQPAPIRYWLKLNGSNILETDEFRLDSASGNLTTKVELDREKQSFYQLIVACEDNGRPQSLENVTPLFVSVLDENDNKPEFLVSPGSMRSTQRKLSGSALLGTTIATKPLATISFDVEEHQSKGLPVGELKAIDRDSDRSVAISYCLIEGNEFQEFSLDGASGILYTNQTLDRERQSSYDLLVKAINDGSTCEELIQGLMMRSMNSTVSAASSAPVDGSSRVQLMKSGDRSDTGDDEARDSSLLLVKVNVLDINDNAPIFRRPISRAGIHHKSLMNTLVTQVAAFDPDSGLNGTLEYRISEVLMYKTSSSYSSSTHQQQSSQRHYRESADQPPLSKPIKLMQNPFRIDQQGNLYTTQLLTQYQLMSMFLLQIEAKELAEPMRIAKTKLEVYIYETSNQLKIRINLHPRVVETYRTELEALFSNSTKFTAIINRARSYYGSPIETPNLSSSLKPRQHPNDNQQWSQTTTQPPHLVKYHQTKTASDDEPTFSNIHLIFVDNFRIVNPNLVMEKFDLTSAPLFIPQLTQQTTEATGQAGSKLVQVNEVSSLIDKIALASAVHSADYQSGGAAALVGIDWLESPSALYVVLTIMLFVVGFVICLFGCCCTSRIKDHIIKSAMDKLVEQQTLQATINESMLAATNQAAGRNEYMMQQQQHTHGSYMSSFDATKGCVFNNHENMSILQRAIDSGDYFEHPQYSTLNGPLNMGSHYYDTSELDGEQQAIQNGAGPHYEVSTSKQMNGSIGSVPKDSDEIEESRLNDDSKMMTKKSKVNGSAMMMMMNNNNNNPPRQRQQIPPNK